MKVDDVSPSLGMIAIQGPKAETIVGQLTDERLDESAGFPYSTRHHRGYSTAPRADRIHGRRWLRVLRRQRSHRRAVGRPHEAGRPEGLEPIGLGARDTLRLEARMPLYGNELADDISPLEAGLGWAVKLEKGPFIGSEAMNAVKAAGAPRRTVGFELIERAGSARHGYPVRSRWPGGRCCYERRPFSNPWQGNRPGAGRCPQ